MTDKLKILHLEDTQSDAELVSKVLKKGMVESEILIVGDRSNYIRELHNFAPDLILSDHTLPSINSYEALEILHFSGKKIPFILVTSTMSEEFAVTAMKAGMDDYILKDRPQRLSEAIRNVIEKYRLEKEREKALAVIIANESLLKEAESLAHFGSWEADLTTGISKWSDETFRIYGYNPQETEPGYEKFLSHIHPQDVAAVKNGIDNAIANLDNYKMEFRIIDVAGKIKYIGAEIAIQRNGRKEPVRLIGFNQDITKQKEAELEVEKVHQSLERIVTERTIDLQKANEALEIFSYSVSHDLRSPLRSVIGFIEIIRKNYQTTFSAELIELFGHIESNSKRMNTILNDLLKLAKYEKEKFNSSWIDMNKLVNKVCDNLYVSMAHQAVIQIADLPKAHADISMIEQVIINLVSNAIKYSSKKEKPIVEIGCKEVEGMPTFFIKDNGAGFDMKYYPRLFGAFQRLHLQDEFEGTGIGLLLVKQIIERHGGKVWAESQLNKGSIFYFSLPKSDSLDESN